jgi:hypothetical protein
MEFLHLHLFQKEVEFTNIQGYDDIKDLVRRALDSDENYNLLFVGPPASAKTLFLLGILECRNGVYFDGSNTTNRILDVVEEERPRVICIDELDKMSRQFKNQLLNFLESGRIKVDQALILASTKFTAQYGVGRGSVAGPTTVINIPPPAPDPTNLTRDDIGNQLGNWIRAGIVPAPSFDEINLLYVILLPTGSTITERPGVGGYHTYTWFDNDPFVDAANLFWAAILTNSARQTSATTFVNDLAYIISHELCEAFTDRDQEGFQADEGCEIGDICESRDPTCTSGATTVNYNVGGRTWNVEQYWSNWDNKCINGDQPVSVKRFLQAIGVNGSTGLRQLGSNVVNVNFVAFRMLSKLGT